MSRHPLSPKHLECEVKLAGRIAELELRLKLLEARVRTLAADERRKAEGSGAPDQTSKHSERVRERPRCPGCLLELPPGRRGDSCVWCGFRFEALKARASR